MHAVKLGNSHERIVIEEITVIAFAPSSFLARSTVLSLFFTRLKHSNVYLVATITMKTAP